VTPTKGGREGKDRQGAMEDGEGKQKTFHLFTPRQISIFLEKKFFPTKYRERETLFLFSCLLKCCVLVVPFCLTFSPMPPGKSGTFAGQKCHFHPKSVRQLPRKCGAFVSKNGTFCAKCAVFGPSAGRFPPLEGQSVCLTNSISTENSAKNLNAHLAEHKDTKAPVIHVVPTCSPSRTGCGRRNPHSAPCGAWAGRARLRKRCGSQVVPNDG